MLAIGHLTWAYGLVGVEGSVDLEYNTAIGLGEAQSIFNGNSLKIHDQPLAQHLLNQIDYGA